MNKYIILSIALATVALTGCETTGDPMQGGLFGWSESKAVYRRDALHAHVGREQQSLASSRARQQNLRSQESRLNTQLAAQRAKLDRMEREVREIERAGDEHIAAKASSLRSRMARLKSSSREEPVQVAQLNNELNSLRAKMNALKNS